MICALDTDGSSYKITNFNTVTPDEIIVICNGVQNPDEVKDYSISIFSHHAQQDTHIDKGFATISINQTCKTLS